MSRFILALLASCFAASTQAATTTLYDQDFENPANYVNDNRDINISTTVNGNYGNQPAGFAFAQTFTVETLNISGSQRGSNRGAFANGYIDPTGQGGDFAVGLQNRDQNDLLGLSFDVGAFDFFNVQIDISSIDLSTFGAPFVTAPNDLPVFQFTLFDNPSAANTTGGGAILDQTTLTGTARHAIHSTGPLASSVFRPRATPMATSHSRSTCWRVAMRLSTT